eukprot:1865072-Pyramimonas_sp.AAC.2
MTFWGRARSATASVYWLERQSANARLWPCSCSTKSMAQEAASSSVQALGCPHASMASKTLARSSSEISSRALRQPLSNAARSSPARKRPARPSPRS